MRTHAHHHGLEWPHPGGWWLVPLIMYAFVLLSLTGAMLIWFL